MAMEGPKKWFKNGIMGTVAAVSMFGGTISAEKNPNDAKLTSPAPVSASAETNAGGVSSETVASYAEAEHQQKINQLEQQKRDLEEKISSAQARVDGAKNDFLQKYHEAMRFKDEQGHDHHKHANLSIFADKLEELTKKVGTEHVATSDVTSDHVASALTDILLSADGGPLKEQAAELMNLELGQLGSTVSDNSVSHAGAVSEDMRIHRALGSDPKDIIKASLEVVSLQYQLSVVSGSLNDLLAQQ